MEAYVINFDCSSKKIRKDYFHGNINFFMAGFNCVLLIKWSVLFLFVSIKCIGAKMQLQNARVRMFEF